MKDKTVLITGNLGYIGVELSSYLKKKYKKIFLIGYETGYFLRNSINKKKLVNKNIDLQIFSDLRDNFLK